MRNSRSIVLAAAAFVAAGLAHSNTSAQSTSDAAAQSNLRELGSALQRSPEMLAEIGEALAAAGSVDDEEDELTAASNAAVDLVKAGKLDEAEKAARDLLERFPEVHDGYDRLGMVYEARGDKKQAAHYYRKVIEFIREHADYYDPEFEVVFHELIAKLDPPAAT